MLNLINLKKTYKIGDIETKALDGISVEFREKEFVAILGASGSGKTTCLNIVGGLDRYDSGEMTIKGKKTKDFKDKDWDAYRNNTIGFVFQSYNLITHLNIVSNVEMGLTLQGVPASERRKKALKVLEQVGLKDHLHKKPNQLSGGQMQRVAIARALVNNPEILLCDEPTGALDTATSVQILDLIKEIAKDRLVIMVTHNPELAEKYADRIIQFKDGKIVSDTNPYEENKKEDTYSLKKTSMSFFTALKLSFNNLRTKKGRTFLTAFASSIGIIGIAVILSLSTGFQKQINAFQSDAMAEFPIIITQNAMQMDREAMQSSDMQMMGSTSDNKDQYVDSDEIYPYDPSESRIIHQNIFSDEYMNHLDNIDPEICKSKGYTRLVNMNLIRKVDEKIVPVSISGGMASMASGTAASNMSNMSSMQGAGLSSYPIQLNENEESYLEKNYDLLYGSYPENIYDLVLVISPKNKISIDALESLGFETEGVSSIKFSEIVGTEFKLVGNNDYYTKTQLNSYLPSQDYEAMYNSENSKTLRISGIVRSNPDSNINLLTMGLAYSDELSQAIIDDAMNSEIVETQKNADYNVLSLKSITEEEKKMFLSILGGNATPFMIMLYPSTFENKDSITSYLDEYNNGKEQDDKVIYTDLASSISSLTGGIMNGITLVLIAFAAISLVVSLIMIGIITYTSVLERTKEIGILRALGARKKDITRVFDAETCILGIFSGLLGIGIAILCTIPINEVIYNVSELKDVAQLQIDHAIILIIISTVLTIIGGHLPARMASKKDAVEALRTE